MQCEFPRLSQKNAPFYVGLFAPGMFFALLAFLGWAWSYSEYNPLSTGMSELGAVNSPFRNAMNFGGFAILGIAISYYSYGFLTFAKNNTALKISSALSLLAGIFLFLVAFFPCDANCVDVTVTGKLHSLISTAPALLMPLAALISAQQLYKKKMKLVGQLSFIFGVLSFASGPLMFLPGTENITGLIQRLGIGFSLLWMMIVSEALLMRNTK